MIGSLKGIVAAIGEGEALIEVQGVGYVVRAGARTLARLAIGAPAHLFIETKVREDAFDLYGFLSDAERAWFARLQETSGVGPKAALAILDVLDPGALQDAIALQDRASLSRANGVGPKLAAKILLDLKDKPPPRGFQRSPAFTAPSNAAGEDDRREGLKDITLRNEAVSALVNLGVAQPEALRAVSAAYRGFADDPSVSVLVKAALKEMGR